MNDPYQVLSVRRDADADEIKRAYRQLAKRCHPDLNPGDDRVAQRFRDATAAYELLSDPAKRARFDRGEIDAAGAERGFGGRSGGSWADDLFNDSIISELLRKGNGGRGERGADVSATLRLPFVDAVHGGKRRVAVTVGRTLEVSVPPAVEDGQTLRLKGQGQPGRFGGAAGDALIRVEVEPHPFFRRRGRDIVLDLPVTLPEAVLGGAVTVPTVHGTVTLKVPPGSNTGTTLRLKGKGLPAQGVEPAGDQLARLQVVLPERSDRELAAFLERWAAAHPYDPRRQAGIL
jgi:DnaJ-class molecular chaperone